MAEPSSEQLSLKTSFGEIAAKGATVVGADCDIKLLAWWHSGNTPRGEAGEQRTQALLVDQNKLLHDQTAQLQAEIDDVRCIVGINIFVHQFPRGAIEWDSLPAHLHGCYPEYAKKLPRQK